ncbi:MAG: glycosyltransferase family 9 protein [Nitrospirota bacterium]|nr:glycosyltransferase family 9 protein [Nitrospirota bacterium]MDH5585751.1 glycosyltransferase family 9 protein [Nitrospirota bacterium]MDH5773688.1 glycosyltransferase family 9 protein [Nitrospirota bacterium]
MNNVLIINITRMGDLIQMIPLLARLQDESPGVGIDLIVDREFGHMAAMIPGIRQVFIFDFQALMDESRVCARDVVSLYQDLSHWAKPLLQVSYDRVINLTFNRRSAFLVKYLGCADERGMTTAHDGSFLVKNPWMKYFLDFHVYRHLNRFNIVDLFALGGSGPGRFHPIELFVTPELADWARTFLRNAGAPRYWVGVQVGASDPMKAWRPEYFGQLMAHLSQGRNVGFVLIGTPKEEPSVEEALQVYRQAGGQGVLCEAVGKTSVPEVVALLQQCQLMVTNDTGPMHMAVGVKTPVVNISVGHVDFRETGPFGPGNWVVQPDIACGPCGFDKVCPHHACKDHLLPQEIAGLCWHVLGEGALPTFSSTIRVFEGGIDEDHLGTFVLRSGQEPSVTAWYGTFWRRAWYEMFTGGFSHTLPSSSLPPDYEEVIALWALFAPQVSALCQQVKLVRSLSRRQPVPVLDLKEAQHRLKEHTLVMKELVRASFAYGPLTVAFIRETFNLEGQTLQAMTEEYVMAAKTFQDRVTLIFDQLTRDSPEPKRRDLYASAIG